MDVSCRCVQYHRHQVRDSITMRKKVTNCTGRSCQFQELVCPQSFPTYPCNQACGEVTKCTNLFQLYNSFDDGLQVLRGIEFMLQGAHSFTHFQIGLDNYLIVANFWDGESTLTESPLFKIEASQDANRIKLTFLQNIKTHGARRWAKLHVNSADYLFLAAYSNRCPVYRWNEITGNLEDSNLLLPTSGASDVVTFTVSGISYVVLSSFRDGNMTQIYAVGSIINSTHSLFGEEVAARHTHVGMANISAKLVQKL